MTTSVRKSVVIRANPLDASSHRRYKHTSKTGRVTIAGRLSDELAPGTLNSILKQAGLKGRMR